MSQLRTSQTVTAMTAVEQERAVAEVQAALTLAQARPRDELASLDRILKACARPTLAERALYAYPRGDETVTGPSIRMAEMIMRHWGNMQASVREISNAGGETTLEAYCWDLETNVRDSKTFTVAHERHTRNGSYKLTDPRDIYEMGANLAARRKRACILALIPEDVVEEAVAQCETTLANVDGAPEDKIKELVTAFEQYGVTSKMLQKRLGHRLDTVIAAEILQLRKIFGSIRDGMAKPGDFFDAGKGADQPAGDVAAGMNAKVGRRRGKPS